MGSRCGFYDGESLSLHVNLKNKQTIKRRKKKKIRENISTKAGVSLSLFLSLCDGKKNKSAMSYCSEKLLVGGRMLHF